MNQPLRDKLTRIFAAKWQDEEHPAYNEMLEKFGFHTTDCVEDLAQVTQAMQDTSSITDDALGSLLHRFFLHALPHLVSAGQLYDYVPQIFPEQGGVHFSD